MRPTFCPRFARCLNLLMSGALIVSMLVVAPLSSAKSPRKTKPPTQVGNPQGNSQRQRQPAPRDNDRRVDPIHVEPSALMTNLPNVEDLKRHKPEKPEAPAPVPSTVKSPKKQKQTNGQEKKGANSLSSESSRNRPEYAAMSARNGSGRLLHHALNLVRASASVVMMPQSGGPTIGNPGFETPAIGAGNFQYGPAGNSWTFAGAGVSGNGSGFTSGNPAAPEGGQVGFIQDTGYISQSISGFQANTNYSVTFTSAQRGNCCNDGGQDIQVLIDDVVIGTFHPTGTTYLDYSTTAFTTTAGTHTLKFYGLNSLGGDHTAFIDNIRIGVPADSAVPLALLDPFNQPGNQLRARDCEWSLPLVSLPGRAGLDLGLTLSYSSMVWTRAGNAIYFDEDNGNPSPGFRLGFPTLGNTFLDTQANVNARMMVTSSGRHIEFRYAGHVGSYDLYKASDSSYAELLDYGNNNIWLRTTGGTNLQFALRGDEWHVLLIRDRNGNKITAEYTTQGDLSWVRDTLGRVINFNYDTNLNLNSITQSWNGQTHAWATFGWETKSFTPAFSNERRPR